MIARIGKKPYADYWLLLLLATASLFGLNQYQYGMWNHFISLPWLFDLINPDLYPQDPLVAQRDFSHSFFLPLIKTLMLGTGASNAVAHFALYTTFLILSFFSFYHLSSTVFNKRSGAILGAVFMSFAFPVLGDVQSWDSLLMERSMALPLLLFSISFLLRGQGLKAVVLLGLAFNLHPLSTVYVAFASALALLFSEGLKAKHGLWALVFLALASPLLFLRFTDPASESLIGFSDVWLEVMRIRNAHHAFPSAYPLLIWFKSLAMGALLVILIWQMPLKKAKRNLLIGFSLGIFLLLILGVVFTEWLPVKIIIQLQFFRSFLFLTFLALALFANALMYETKPLYYLLFPLLLFQFWEVETAKGLGFLGLSFATWFTYRFITKVWLRLGLMTVLIVGLGLTAYVLRGGINWKQGSQSEDWYELQDWFSLHTASDALAIVPPSQPGFRVQSRRSSYGDWFDGTKAFFSEDYAQIWLHRMHSLKAYGPDSLKETYLALEESDFTKISKQEKTSHSQVYLVHFAQAELTFPLIYENPSFKVYRLWP